jgi:3-hydroxyacyl-[acyl-carrier-protein] dehydratase
MKNSINFNLIKSNFYKILSEEITNEEFKFSIEINPNHPIFEGHFPGNPVTPGVVQMEIIKELVGTGIRKKVELSTMSNCKFLSVLNPIESTIINVSIKYLIDENSIKTNVSISNSNTTFLKMAAIYR